MFRLPMQNTKLWGGEKRAYIFYHALVGSSPAIFHLKHLNLVPWKNVLFKDVEKLF